MLEEEHLFSIEQESKEEAQIGLHAHQATNVKLVLKLVKLTRLEAHLTILLAYGAHIAQRLQPGGHRLGDELGFSA